MKNPCPTPYTLHPNSGFTLIELMVVVVITALLVGGGVAAYNNFNQNQILNQAASTLKTNLRDAQNRALSGEKVCGPGACGGTNSICGDETGELPLDGWQVTFSSGSYTMTGVCGGLVIFPSPTPTPIPLPGGVTISTFPSPNPIKFKSLPHGTNIVDSATIILSYNGRTKNVIVTSGGDVYITD